MSTQGTTRDTTVYSDFFRHTLDDKNRITMPSAWRYVHDVNDEFLAIKQDDGSIAVFPPDAATRMRQQASQIPTHDLAQRKRSMRFFSSSRSFTFDKQGRFALTDAQRAHAKITKDVVLAGAGDSFVIYSPELWEQDSRPQPDDREKLGI